MYLQLSRLYEDSPNTQQVHREQLAERFALMYRMWHEASGNPEHLKKAAAWAEQTGGSLQNQ